MDMIKVLLLDDDNHDYTVVYEDNYRCSMREFLHNMAAPHSVCYKIHIVHLVNLPCDNIRVGPFVMALDNWFDVIACDAVPLEYYDKKEFCKCVAFDVMWNRSEIYA